jgi:hypothetical protein
MPRSLLFEVPCYDGCQGRWVEPDSLFVSVLCRRATSSSSSSGAEAAPAGPATPSASRCALSVDCLHTHCSAGGGGGCYKWTLSPQGDALHTFCFCWCARTACNCIKCSHIYRFQAHHDSFCVPVVCIWFVPCRREASSSRRATAAPAGPAPTPITRCAFSDCNCTVCDSRCRYPTLCCIHTAKLTLHIGYQDVSHLAPTPFCSHCCQFGSVCYT